MPIDVHPENQRLVAWMQIKGLNASQLAQRLETSRATISHVVNGRNKLSLNLVQSLAREFSDFDLYYVVMGKHLLPGQALTEKAPNERLVNEDLVGSLETLIIIEGDHFEVKTRRSSN
ncbi:MAG: helix-turn-helix transcriptional regulator [Schleiferiaceae bacterium]|nr:helix-turn-helix transcriptional regulator [Schleiferiaceae bacterium]